MNDMTLSSGHRIRIRALAVTVLPSFKETSHNIKSLRVSEEEIIVSLKPECQSEGRNPRSAIFQAGSFSHCARPLPQLFDIESEVQS